MLPSTPYLLRPANGVIAPSGGGVTWDPATTPTTITLSGGNLTATANTAGELLCPVYNEPYDRQVLRRISHRW